MKKFRPPLKSDEIKELERLSKLDFSNYSETDVREEFLVGLLVLLGYRKEHDYSVSREDQFKLNPLFLSIGSKRIKLDYLCSLRKNLFWLLEAKEGKCKNKNRPPNLTKKDIAQAHFYTFHPEINCKYFVVSNGWFVNLYHRDRMDKNFNPILTIKHNELQSRFMELDSYIGSSQILSHLKEDILEQIEKTLKAEIRVDRLNEFATEVRMRLAKLRPIVESQTRELYLNHTNDLFRELETEDLPTMVYSTFQNLRTNLEVRTACERIIQRLLANRTTNEFKEYFFFDRLILNKSFPVTYWYYSSVLYFLLKLAESDLKELRYGKKTCYDLLDEWVDLCLFHLSKRPDLRYNWLMEGIYTRLAKKIFLFFPFLRSEINKQLDKTLFYFEEEKITSLNAAHQLINFVESLTLVNITIFHSKFYNFDKSEFKAVLANQEYTQLHSILDQFENIIGDKYELIKQELGSSWSEAMSFETINLSFDPLGSAICSVLNEFPDYVKTFSDERKQRIKLLAELGYTNYASELCKVLKIECSDPMNPSEDILKKRKLFFLPQTNQYTL